DQGGDRGPAEDSGTPDRGEREQGGAGRRRRGGGLPVGPAPGTAGAVGGQAGGGGEPDGERDGAGHRQRKSDHRPQHTEADVRHAASRRHGLQRGRRRFRRFGGSSV